MSSDEHRDAPPGQNPEDDAGSSLWRLLNDEGSMAGEDASVGEGPKPPSAANPAAWGMTAEETRAAESKPKPAPKSESLPAPSAKPDEHWSQIRKILEAPDTLDADTDFSTPTRVAEAAGGDGDPSVLAYMRDEALLIKCRKHPYTDAKAQCPECQAYYCQECLVIRKGRLLCRDCADTIFVPTEEQVLAAAESGGESAEDQVMPTAAPEFQVGSEMFGREGHPAHPVKQIVALVVDLVLARGGMFLILWLLAATTNMQGPVVDIFSKEGTELGVKEVLRSFGLGLPPVPWMVLFFFTDFVYYFLSLSFTNRSPGMSATGCRIATVWGDFVPFGAVAMRTLIFLMQFSLPGLVLAFFIPSFRGLHDLLAGTIVVNYAGVKRVDAYETIQIKL